jgi:hypothetical protein
MTEEIRIKIRKYLKGKISSDVCECCGKERLIVIDGVCIWCLRLITEYLRSQFGTKKVVTQPRLTPVFKGEDEEIEEVSQRPQLKIRKVKLEPGEIAEMSHGARKVKPKQAFEWK